MTRSSGSSRRFALVRVGHWWCPAKRVSARPRCLIIWPEMRRDAVWCVPRATSPRWSWRSPHCISCAPPCWTASRDCRSRSVMPCGSRSAWAPDRHRTGSWSGWRSSTCFPTLRSRSHLFVWLTTSSGSIAHLPKCWASLLDDWWRNQSGWSSRPVSPAPISQGCRISPLRGCPKRTRERSWIPR